MRTLSVLGVLIGAFGAMALSSQSIDRPSVLLKFVGEKPPLVTIINESGVPQSTRVGMALQEGWTLHTSAGACAELQTQDDGTMLRVSENSTLHISGLRRPSDPKSFNDFALPTGLLRVAMVSRTSRPEPPSLNVKTPVANCGTSGADFLVRVDDEHGSESVLVLDGLVHFAADASGATLRVSSEMTANALGQYFVASKVDAKTRRELLAQTQFEVLNPSPELEESVVF